MFYISGPQYSLSCYLDGHYIVQGDAFYKRMAGRGKEPNQQMFQATHLLKKKKKKFKTYSVPF